MDKSKIVYLDDFYYHEKKLIKKISFDKFILKLYYRPLNTYVNEFINNGFRLVKMVEPKYHRKIRNRFLDYKKILFIPRFLLLKFVKS